MFFFWAFLFSVMCYHVCVCVCPCFSIFLSSSWVSLSSDVESAVAKERNPRPWLRRTEGYMQANVEYAKKENGVFRSSACSVYDGDWSQDILCFVLVYLDACACMVLYREKSMVCLYCTLSIRQLCFSTNLCCAVGGDVGWRNRVAALVGKCIQYFG